MLAEVELNEVPRVLQTKVPDSPPPLAPARPVSISLGLLRSPIAGACGTERPLLEPGPTFEDSHKRPFVTDAA